MKKTSVINTTDAFAPIKSITNGAILLNNNIKVTGVKITPRNIFILDQQSQDNIILQLRTFYDSIDYEFWIIIADRPVDINVYISQLQVHYNEIQDVKKRKLIIDDLNKAQMFINENVVDTEYYLLFKEKNEEVLQRKLRGLITGLATCGLTAAQTSNDDLRVVLDNFLNGGKSFNVGTVKPL
ncbi:MAG: hypothetical protein GX861_01140 [Tenericutes bacterium]|nr:hypothetical protein [Mycoplasmatota bacterium]